MPVRATKKSTVSLQELAFFDLGGNPLKEPHEADEDMKK